MREVELRNRKLKRGHPTAEGMQLYVPKWAPTGMLKCKNTTVGVSTDVPARCIAAHNPRPTGGGYFLPPPLVCFCNNSISYLRIIAKFSIPSRPSISHILTKRKLANFDVSAINDVIVTSCFPDFRKK